MEISCGTDIIEIDRVKKLIDDGGKTALDKLFSASEQEYCESKKQVKYQHYAVRFSAKEAIFKAISNRLNDKFEVSWTDVEIINDKNGRPAVNFIRSKPRGMKKIDISLSHCREYAVAYVIATWE